MLLFSFSFLFYRYFIFIIFFSSFLIYILIREINSRKNALVCDFFINLFYMNINMDINLHEIFNKY